MNNNVMARAEKALEDYDAGLVAHLDLDEAIKMVIRRAEAAEARAAQLESERAELIEWRDTGAIEIETLTAERDELRAELSREEYKRLVAESERDEARRQLEQAREASFELGRTLQFTRIGWDDTVTCESVLEPINKIAFKIGEALGIDDLH